MTWTRLHDIAAPRSRGERLHRTWTRFHDGSWMFALALIVGVSACDLAIESLGDEPGATADSGGDGSGGDDSNGDGSDGGDSGVCAVQDPFEIDNIRVERNTMFVAVGYGGGCESHAFEICPEVSFLESDPPVAVLTMAHDANGDLCEAYLMEERPFDLTWLKQTYYEAYRTFDRFGISIDGHPGVGFDFTPWLTPDECMLSNAEVVVEGCEGELRIGFVAEEPNDLSSPSLGECCR